MSLVLFDLDNTLLSDDSDHLWGEFLVEQNLVDKAYYQQQNDLFYQQYQQGTLDIYEFLAFMLTPLSQYPMAQLLELRQPFIRQKIIPVMLPKAKALIAQHKQQQDTLVIITATNQFITQPIAELFGVPNLIATQAEIKDNQYTGKIAGTPCFQAGKVSRLQQWLQQSKYNLDNSTFYSDSYNDKPLLELVTHPIAVDPDQKLQDYAKKQGWKIISLR